MIPEVALPPKLIPIFHGEADVRGAYGGRGSAKTRSFAKMTAVRAFMWAAQQREGIILCGRQFQNSLDESSMYEVKQAIESEPWLRPAFDIGEKYIRTVDRRINFKFSGLERNIASVKSKARILLCWADEAEPITEKAWQVLIPTLREEDWLDAECFGGLDLASKVDIAAFMRVYRRGDQYAVFGSYYLPERAVESGTNSQYDGWRRRGLLTVTDGEVTDYDRIEDDIVEVHDTRVVTAIGFDPAQATQLVGHLLDKQLPMVEIRPTVLNFSEPMKELEALVLKGRLKHNGDPVLTWMVSNVVCHRDAKDNIYPRKERPENKIDGVVALITALNRAIAPSSEGSSWWDKEPADAAA